MSTTMIDNFCMAAARRLRPALLDTSALAAMALCGCISLGFATFAAYQSIRAVEGRVVAALVVCAFYGLLSLSFFVRSIRLRRAKERLRIAALAAPPSNDSLARLLQSLADNGTPESRALLLAATKLARALSPMERLALATAAGLLAGRHILK